MTGCKRIALCSALGAVITMAVATPSARAQGAEKGTFGLGLILGEPTGVSAKLYLDDDSAIDAAIGGAFIGGGWQVHADYLRHPWVLEERDLFVLPAYIGAGLRMLRHDQGGAASDIHLGIRLVGGMLFDFKEIPLDVFVELAGVGDYRIADDDAHAGFGLDLNVGAGVRYYF